LDLTDHRFLDVTDQEAACYALREGDLLFTRYNGTIDFVGACAMVGNDIHDYVYPDKLIRVRVKRSVVVPEFLAVALGARSAREQIEDFVKSSAGQKGISGADLKAVKLSLPDIAEQTEIVHRVEALFALADRIEARCTAARTHAQRLAPQLLAKAFRGELVPQDPNDEPATALLARIAAEHSAAPTPNKTRLPKAARSVREPKKELSTMSKSRQDADVSGQPYLATHLRRLGGQASAELLFKAAELPVADFYKQLAWEVAHGHVLDGDTTLAARDAA
jgi:Type I restriction modification DNA specificity domain